MPAKLSPSADKLGYGDFIHLEHNERDFADITKGEKFFRRVEQN